MNSWQPIETAPKAEDKEIIVYTNDGYFVAVWDRRSGWCEATHGDPLSGANMGAWSEPTHWMPLNPPTV